MLVGEFLQRLNRGETVSGIGQMLGLHRKTLQRRLKRLGYFWDQNLKKWVWKGKGKEPLHVSLTDLPGAPPPPFYERVHPHSPDMKEIDSPQVKWEGRPQENHYSHTFTQDELALLKEIISWWKKGSGTDRPWQDREPESGVRQSEKASLAEKELLERIQTIRANAAGKVRKTIVIDQEIAGKLDDFAERQRLNKSDLLHLAIQDLIEKYS